MGLDPVEIIAVDVARRVLALVVSEAAARRARRSALVGAAHRHGAKAILLGHTRDDQAGDGAAGTRSRVGESIARGHGGS